MIYTTQTWWFVCITFYLTKFCLVFHLGSWLKDKLDSIPKEIDTKRIVTHVGARELTTVLNLQTRECPTGLQILFYSSSCPLKFKKLK